MLALRKLIKVLTNAGVYGSYSLIERRRIRILNMFNTICGLIILLYSVINFIVGSYSHGILILSSLILITLPVYLLNNSKRQQTAKFYFVFAALLIVNLVGYRSIFEQGNRDNEYFFLGFSVVIIALFDNPSKTYIFILSAFSALLMKSIRLFYFSDVITPDNYLALTNLAVGFLCIFLFTDIFKNDLLKSEKRIRRFADRVNRQKYLVQSERDELVYNKQLIRTTIDNLPVFITMMDTRGKFIIVNSRFERALKKKTEDIEGKKYYEVLGADISRLSKPLFNQCLKGKDIEINYPILFPSGESIHAFGKYTPLLNNRGKVTHVLAFVTDISEIKHTENELREINSSKDKILSILSHDLRGPLNSLSGLLGYSSDIDPSVLDKLLKTVKKQVDVLNFTLDNVLSWVKTQLGGFVAHPQIVNVASLIKNSTDLYDERFKEKSIHIEDQINSKFNVRIDPDHLEIVIRNLVSNSIKFTPMEGKILFDAKSVKSSVKLSIKDSGMGMNESAISQVLSGINRERPNTSLGTDGEKGTGLGLSFCLDILKMNDATMEIISEPGHGTEIILTIPKG
ncbi:MAG: PAS domain-containing sensor histidine kinase [Reichenbachiella sp.]|uniref:PAS domain-containing sensor histidine kinase n=1 Tax=Reichenbachiella sp. TaxID=2184521 RepID=UPI0032653A0B